jgi:predicted neuraminidase
MLTLKLRAGLAVVATTAACACLPPAAMATPDSCVSQVCHWFSGSLGQDDGWGSVEAHSITYVEGDAYITAGV